jgi:hypothetical protein
MEDAHGNKKKLLKSGLIQETGQEKRPARMVGLFGSESAKSGMDAGCDDHVELMRQRED